MCPIDVQCRVHLKIFSYKIDNHDSLITGDRSFYRPQRSCEGYVFTGVCLSTGGEYLTRYTPPGTRYTPPSRHPPGTRCTPLDQVHPPPDQVPPPRPGTSPSPGTRYTPLPGTRYTTPGPGTPPWDQVHPLG